MSALPWLTQLNAQLYFGPRPKTPDDMKYLTKTLGLHLVLNASTSTAANKRTGALDRDAYARDYADDFDFVVIKAPLVIPTSGGDEGATSLLAAVRAIQPKVVGPCYVHAETGLYEEAYIALLLWRLIYPNEAPADIAAWLRAHHKDLLFDDDEEKRGLLIACWTLLDDEQRTQRKIRMFGTPMKRAKK